MFRGSIVALVTPFKDGKVDEKAFQSLVRWQIDQGTEGLVPCGTTGESPTLSEQEQIRVVTLCVEAAAGKVPVLAGSGSNSTDKTVKRTRAVKEAGANGALIVTPYYNKPTQDGLFHHYKTVHDEVDIPIVIYNIPGRSAVDMSVETMAQLAKLPRIVGVKDATGDLARVSRTRRAVGQDFCQLSGEDATTVALLAQGGHGCISVSCNVAPRLCAELHRAWAAGDPARALELHDKLMPLHDALFCESSPGPVKYAASLLGLCEATARSPLVPVTDSTRERVSTVLREAGLLPTT